MRRLRPHAQRHAREGLTRLRTHAALQRTPFCAQGRLERAPDLPVSSRTLPEKMDTVGEIAAALPAAAYDGVDDHGGGGGDSATTPRAESLQDSDALGVRARPARSDDARAAVPSAPLSQRSDTRRALTQADESWANSPQALRSPTRELQRRASHLRDASPDKPTDVKRSSHQARARARAPPGGRGSIPRARGLAQCSLSPGLCVAAPPS